MAMSAVPVINTNLFKSFDLIATADSDSGAHSFPHGMTSIALNQGGSYGKGTTPSEVYIQPLTASGVLCGWTVTVNYTFTCTPGRSMSAAFL